MVTQFSPHAVGDFDQDGNDDYIVGRPGFFDAASVFWGDGTGAFPTSIGLGVPGEPISVVVGKFDSDTIPDIAIANHRYGFVRVNWLEPLGVVP